MNHYSKQAAMLIRLIGSVMILLGAVGLVYWVVAGLALESKSPEHAWQSTRLISAFVFIFAGALIYAVGKPIGKVIGSDLDE